MNIKDTDLNSPILAARLSSDNVAQIDKAFKTTFRTELQAAPKRAKELASKVLHKKMQIKKRPRVILYKSRFGGQGTFVLNKFDAPWYGKNIHTIRYPMLQKKGVQRNV